MGPLANAETRLSELRPQLETKREEWRLLGAELDDLEVWLALHGRNDPGEPGRALREATARHAGVTLQLDRAGRALAASEATVRELEPQRIAVSAERDCVLGSLQGVSGWLEDNARPAMDGHAAALQAAELTLRQTQEAVTSATAALAVAESRHAIAVEAAGGIDELESVSSELRRLQSDWTLLARCLGRDGLQAALIDAAGPQLTEMANDLLHRCVGPRFSVSFETTRLDAKGKKTLEDFDVRVFDADAGKWKLAKRLSGGELALVSLAVSLALTQLACQRQGTRGATLIRDESGAALDAEKAPQYVAMLRLAAEAIGADRVLLVSHVPGVVELCDARLELNDGEARLVA